MAIVAVQRRCEFEEARGVMGELLRYGNWSGPGWSNGTNYGGRVLTDAELRTPGIDAYDNYVAKAHDLNEFFAAERLRETLASLGPKFRDLLQRHSNNDFVVPLVYAAVPGFSSQPRFVDMLHYVPTAPAAIKDQVAEAFFSYFNHVMRSNLQFAIDYVYNEVNLFKPRAFLMNIQLLGGSHFFLNEANWVEEQLNDLERSQLVSRAYIDGEPARLETNFVSPTTSNLVSQYISPVNPAYVRKIQMGTLLSADRRTLLLHGVAIRNAKNRVD